jgi:uncharacterized protein
MKYVKIMLLTLLLFSASVFAAAADIPERPASWVNDYAGVLNDTQVNELNGMLSSLEQRSSNQIFVAIFPQIPEGYYLEDFVVKLFDKWKPGLMDKDNGILIAVFINDRKMRIEVGYGLEDVITDAQSATLIREYMAPEFKKGDYYAGIKNALTVLIPAVEGKYKIPIKKKSNKSDGFSLGDLITLIIIIAIIARIFGGGGSTGYGSKRKGGSGIFFIPFFLGGGGGSSGGGSFGGGGFGGGGFSGGFGGMSGGGGASGGW